MTQRVKVHTAQSLESSIPRTHIMVDRETTSVKLSSDLHIHTNREMVREIKQIIIIIIIMNHNQITVHPYS